MRTDVDAAYALAHTLLPLDVWEHTKRVVTILVRSGATYGELTAAYLHDIVEDTPMTLDCLRALGFHEVVVQAVDDLTRRRHERETYRDYIQRIADTEPHSYARSVKRADIKDHLAQKDTLKDSLVGRYEYAAKMLEV